MGLLKDFIYLKALLVTLALSGCTLSTEVLRGSESTAPQGALVISNAKRFNNKNYIPSHLLDVEITSLNADEVTFFSDSKCAIPLGPAEPIAKNKNIALPSPTAGTKYLSAIFHSKEPAQDSSCISMSLELLPDPPTAIAVSPNTDFSADNTFYSNKDSVLFSLAATQAPLTGYELSSGAVCGDGTTKTNLASSIPADITGADGKKIFSIQFFDIFDRASSCQQVEVVKDTTPGMAPEFLSGAQVYSGHLNETPRFFLRKHSEIRDSIANSGVKSYEARLTDSDGVEVIPWTNVGNHESFVLSKNRNDESQGIKNIPSLNLEDGKNYRVYLRSYDQLNQRSAESLFTFSAQAPRILLPSKEHALQNTLITESFKAQGVGSGVPFSINGGKVCEEPCDIQSASASTITLYEGKSYTVGAMSGPSNSSLKEFRIEVGTPPNHQTTKWFIATNSICNSGFVLVPEDPVLGTQAFCIAQFEMKKDPNWTEPVSSLEGEVYTGLDKTESQAACASISARLPTNTEWNAVARNIASVDENWSVDESGNKLKLNRGNSSGSAVIDNSSDLNNHCEGTSDSPCLPNEWKAFKRTHQLSTGEFIWDFVGNVWEIVDDETIDYDLPNIENAYLTNLPTTNFMNFVLGLPTSLACYQPYNNDYCNLGWGWITGAKPGKAIYRGGTKHSGNNAGPFTIDYDEYPTNKTNYHGFRCVYDIVEPN